MNRGLQGVLVFTSVSIAIGCVAGSTGYYPRDGSADGTTTSDGGAKDGKAPSDATLSDTFVPPKIDASNCQGSGLTGCTPQSVCSFVPSPPPAAAKQPGVCTAQDVQTFYDACIDPGNSTNCTNFTQTKANCFKCLLTPDTSSAWGALIQDQNDLLKNNIAGCFSVKGNGSCEGAVASDQQCTAAACPDTVCPVPSGDTTALSLLNKCLTDSDASNCASYKAAAASCLTNPACTGSDFRSTYVVVATAICVNGF